MMKQCDWGNKISAAIGIFLFSLFGRLTEPEVILDIFFFVFKNFADESIKGFACGIEIGGTGLTILDSHFLGHLVGCLRTYGPLVG